MSWKGFRRLFYVLMPASLFFVYADISTKGWSILCWNWMYYTGVITFTVSIALAIGLTKKLDGTFEALRTNNSLILNTGEINALKEQLELNARPWRFWCGIFIFLIVFGSWIYSLVWEIMYTPFDWNQFLQLGFWTVAIAVTILFFIIFVMGVCGFYAGTYFGTSAGHGTLATLLARKDSGLHIRPDHYDGAAGLKPIGDLYLYQAFLTALPLVWFAGWWLFIPVYDPPGCGGNPDYSSWRWPFVAQWLVTLTFTYFGFIKPMLVLRNRVVDERNRILSEKAPKITAEIHQLQRRLIQKPMPPEEENAIKHRIDDLGRYLWSVRQMSSWPMDAKTRRRYFSLNALVSVAPPVINSLVISGAVTSDLPTDGPWGWLGKVFNYLF